MVNKWQSSHSSYCLLFLRVFLCEHDFAFYYSNYFEQNLLATVCEMQINTTIIACLRESAIFSVECVCGKS